MRTSKLRGRIASLLATMAIAAGAIVALQATTMAPAAAVPGLVKVRALSVINSDAEKTAIAYCPPGTRVLGGGGGLVWDASSQTREVVLTRMQPVHPLLGNDYYAVGGVETADGEATSWWLEAYALCATPLAGMHIVLAATNLASTSAQLAEANCPAGESVLGGGAWVVQPTGGQVGLQVMRSSISGQKVYGQAHEDGNGYTGQWNVTAFAVCAPTPAGYEVINAPSTYAASEPIKTAFAYCPAGKRVHGAGAAIAFNAPGQVSLTRIIVDWYDTGLEVEAIATENDSTGANWDFIVAQVICAN